MADFIVSGQIPGTQFQITFVLWSVLVILGVAFYAAQASYRSKMLRAWLITVSIFMTIRTREVTRI